MSRADYFKLAPIAVWVVFWLGVNAWTYTDSFAQVVQP